MSSAIAKNIADLQYGGLYLPLFSLVYLFDKLELPYTISLFDHTFLVVNTSNFQLIFAATFIGALVNHGLNRSIFGPEGPLQNPKDPWTVKYQKFALAFTKQPARRPETHEDMVDIVDSCTSQVGTLLTHLIKGDIQQRIAVCLHVFKSLLRTMIILLSRPFYIVVTIGAIALLYDLVIHSEGDYLGIGLLLAQTAFSFGTVVLSWFPSVVPTDSARWLFVPEYRKSPELYGNDEIEFEYDPRGFNESVLEQVGEVKRESMKKDQQDNDVDYLISLGEERESVDYLIPLEDSDK